jgi:hypothetical protein
MPIAVHCEVVGHAMPVRPELWRTAELGVAGAVGSKVTSAPS